MSNSEEVIQLTEEFWLEESTLSNLVQVEIAKPAENTIIYSNSFK